MKKNKLMFFLVFIMFLLFIYINGVKAEERLNCVYVSTGQEELGFNATRTLDVTFFLSYDDDVMVEKVIQKFEPDSNCKSYLMGIGYDENTANGNCVAQKAEFTSNINVDFDIRETDDCPKRINISTLSSGGKILSEAASGYGYELKSSARKLIDKITCGNVTRIPKKIVELTSLAITIVQIAVPVLLVIMGAIDLFKGITAGKEDEMKKGQQMFIKRLIVGALIFFVVAVVKLLVSVVANSSDTANISSCISCFVNNDCD